MNPTIFIHHKLHNNNENKIPVFPDVYGISDRIWCSKHPSTQPRVNMIATGKVETSDLMKYHQYYRSNSTMIHNSSWLFPIWKLNHDRFATIDRATPVQKVEPKIWAPFIEYHIHCIFQLFFFPNKILFYFHSYFTTRLALRIQKTQITIGSDNGFLMIGDKLSSEPITTKVSDTTWRTRATTG